MAVPVIPIPSVHEIGEELGSVSISDNWGADGDIVINKPVGLIFQKRNGVWNRAIRLRGSTVTTVHQISEELGADEALSDNWGADGDLVVNKAAGVAFQKLNGTWGQLSVILVSD